MSKLTAESWVTIIVALAVLNVFVCGSFILLVIYAIPTSRPLTALPISSPQPSPVSGTAEAATAEASSTATSGIVPTFTPTSTSEPGPAGGTAEPQQTAASAPRAPTPPSAHRTAPQSQNPARPLYGYRDENLDSQPAARACAGS